ncbi:MAG TPA: hypothetical protein DCQ37_20150 [Desulfobacteraceae bacterium]|nr:hypothetical protein [Desulfobacteraceae bacterium]
MTLNQILESAEKLSYEQIDLLIGVLYKRQIETRRNEIARNAREAIAAFHRGELKTESADELINRLHACPEAEEE